MAYIAKERVAEIRAELKKAFPNTKFSVTRSGYTTVSVVILKSEIDFFDDTFRNVIKLDNFAKTKKYTGVNVFNIDSVWSGKARAFLSNVAKIVCAGMKDHNAEDMGADYPAWNFHAHIFIGDFNRPYEVAPSSLAA